MKQKFIPYLAGAGLLAVVTMILLPLRPVVNTTTIGFVLLIVVLVIAAAYGRLPALVVSILSLLVFNYFFIPPYHTFTIADPQNWVALFAFLSTSLIAGGLSAKEKKRAVEAEKLYDQLRAAFQKADEAEILKQSEQLKSAFLDAVTHDLRTPLTSMKAAVTTLLAERSDELGEEGRRELLEVVDSEIDRMNRLVEELIQMARIEAGAMEPQRSWTNMEEIVTNVLSRAAGITAGHKIRIDLKENLPLLRVDEKTIAEVLYIMIENATKFSPLGSEISVIVFQVDQGIQVSVEDRGPGIPLEMREKVFDKFFRFSKPARSVEPFRPPGLGMGLSIARAIVEAHGGKMWIEDPLGDRGARVSFVIPLQQEAKVV